MRIRSAISAKYFLLQSIFGCCRIEVKHLLRSPVNTQSTFFFFVSLIVFPAKSAVRRRRMWVTLEKERVIVLEIISYRPFFTVYIRDPPINIKFLRERTIE